MSEFTRGWRDKFVAQARLQGKVLRRRALTKGAKLLRRGASRLETRAEHEKLCHSCHRVWLGPDGQWLGLCADCRALDSLVVMTGGFGGCNLNNHTFDEDFLTKNWAERLPDGVEVNARNESVYTNPNNPDLIPNRRTNV